MQIELFKLDEPMIVMTYLCAATDGLACARVLVVRREYLTVVNKTNLACTLLNARIAFQCTTYQGRDGLANQSRVGFVNLCVAS